MIQPGLVLGLGEQSSIAHLAPATATNSARVMPARRVARKYASSSSPFSSGEQGPADQQPVPGAGGGDQRPVVKPRPFRPIGAVQPLPCLLRDQGGQLARALAPARWRSSRCPRRPSRTRSPALPAIRAARGLPPYASSPANQANSTSALTARSIICRASSGLVTNATPSPIPAARHRSRSSVHFSGRYSSRSISARDPSAAAYARNTPSCAVLHPARGPRILTGNAGGHPPLLQEPRLIHGQHRRRTPEVPHHVAAHRVPAPVLVPGKKFSSRCIPSGPRHRRTPPSTTRSSAPDATAAPAGTPARASATAALANTPATCANISLNDSDHAACPAPAATRASPTTASMPQAWPLRNARSRSHTGQHHSPLL